MKSNNQAIDVAKRGVKVPETRVASPQQFATMLTRNIPGPVIPEARLIIAVLRQAADDAQSEWKRFLRSHTSGNAKPVPADEFIKKPSIRFWTDGGMAAYAELVGLDPVFVYEQFARHLGMDLDASACARARETLERCTMRANAMARQHADAGV